MMRSIAEQAARAGGQVLLERFSSAHTIRSKGFRDIVTEADTASQDAILKIIRQHFPEHDVLSEEGQASRQAHEWLWVVDPLDGTVNYSRCLPGFAVSLAAVQHGQAMLGVVFDPLHERLFVAERDAGAALNGQALHVSQRADIAQCVIGLDWARSQAVRERVVASLGRVAPAVGTLRAIGSAALALCYVAAGWLDAYFHLALQAWDGAAAGLLIQEAGGTLSTPGGQAWTYSAPACVASNGLIHPALLGLIGASNEAGERTP